MGSLILTLGFLYLVGLGWAKLKDNLNDRACRLEQENEEKLIISLANLLYKIDMDTKDKKLIWKSLKKNKEFLKSVNMPEQNLKYSIMEVTFDALQYKYHLEEEIENI